MRGNGTSLITLIIPPGNNDSLARVSRMLVEEQGAAANIKSRVNRLSVIGAVTSVQQKLKTYKKLPEYGLVIFCGTVDIEGKSKKVNIDFEPVLPVKRSAYLCDSRFHTESILNQLDGETEDAFGFVVVDGRGALFAQLKGDDKVILHRFSVELPKKHGRGGQSANRFARLGQEARHNYLKKVAETAADLFIRNDAILVKGLILAGSADLKSHLAQMNLFDKRLKERTLAIVDVAYGGEAGLHQAINLASERLTNVKYVKEKELLSYFFDLLTSGDSNTACFGINDTMYALEMGAVETLICWQDLDIKRFLLENASSKEKKIVHAKKIESAEDEMEVISEGSLLHWLVDNYRSTGCAKLELVSNSSPEGSQFVKGFGGIAAVLRYSIDINQIQELEDNEDFNLDDY